MLPARLFRVLPQSFSLNWKDREGEREGEREGGRERLSSMQVYFGLYIHQRSTDTIVMMLRSPVPGEITHKITHPADTCYVKELTKSFLE